MHTGGKVVCKSISCVISLDMSDFVSLAVVILESVLVTAAAVLVMLFVTAAAVLVMLFVTAAAVLVMLFPTVLVEPDDFLGLGGLYSSGDLTSPHQPLQQQPQ